MIRQHGCLHLDNLYSPPSFKEFPIENRYGGTFGMERTVEMDRVDRAKGSPMMLPKSNFDIPPRRVSEYWFILCCDEDE